MFVPHVGFQHGLKNERGGADIHVLSNFRSFMDEYFTGIKISDPFNHHEWGGFIEANSSGRCKKVPIFAGTKGVKLHCCGFRFSGYERFICEQLPTIPQNTTSRWFCMPDPSLSEKITNAVGNWWPSVKRPKRSSGGAVHWCRCRIWRWKALEMEGSQLFC